MIINRHAVARGARQAGIIWAAASLGVLSSCGSSTKGDLFHGGGEPMQASGGHPGDAHVGSGGGPPKSCVASACPVSGTFIGCCTSDFQCGLLVGKGMVGTCVSPDHGGADDQSCPNAFVLDGADVGCCRSNHTCGYDDRVYGTGCVDPVQLGLVPGKPCP